MKLHFSLAAISGLLTWLLVSLVTLFLLVKLPGDPPMFAVGTLLLVYGVSFVLLTQDHHLYGLTGTYGRYLLWLPLAAAFTVLLLLPPGFFDYLAILSIIWVGFLPYVMPKRQALLLTAVVVICWFSLQALLEQRSLWITASLFGAFHLFAVVMQVAIAAEQQATQALATKNLELQSAQQLLLTASKQTERTRIARNLHDLLGHHLTAMTIQLQVASHHCDGKAKQQVDDSLQLARLLLSDVREVVSTMREDTDLNLLQLLQTLRQAVPVNLELELDIAPEIHLPSVLQAQHLLMIVREAISNALKHSGASKLRIVARLFLQQLHLTIIDNGHIAANWQRGNGLKGMQERLTECGGNLMIEIQNGALQLNIQLPQEPVSA